MMASNPSLKPEIGPDGLPREAPVISYTEKIIEEEQLQIRKYIDENYSKIRDVERELANLSMEMKLTAGPKKAALEHMRKKIEMSTERIRAAKLKEEEAHKAWEAAAKAVKDEEALKEKLCEDLNKLVQESSHAQFTRLEELKRRLEALNLGRPSTSSPADGKSMGHLPNNAQDTSSAVLTMRPVDGTAENASDQAKDGITRVTNGQAQPTIEGEGKTKRKVQFQGRGRGIGAVPKGRGTASSGWTGAGFDVDARS